MQSKCCARWNGAIEQGGGGLIPSQRSSSFEVVSIKEIWGRFPTYAVSYRDLVRVDMYAPYYSLDVLIDY